MGCCASSSSSGPESTDGKGAMATSRYMSNRLADVFEALDKNHDDKITMGELRAFVHQNHIDFAPDELEEAVENTFDLADINHDHVIDSDEFCAVFCNVFRQQGFTIGEFEKALESKFGKVAAQCFEVTNAVG